LALPYLASARCIPGGIRPSSVSTMTTQGIDGAGVLRASNRVNCGATRSTIGGAVLNARADDFNRPTSRGEQQRHDSVVTVSTSNTI
jgi:hypothetical protein